MSEGLSRVNQQACPAERSGGRPLSSRRLVLASGCAAMLAGCQVYGGEAAPPADVPPAGADGGTGNGGAPPGVAPSGAPSATAGAPAGAGGKPALAKVSDIPVGGGKVFADQKVVVTQPSAGVIKAFSAVCTHQGCLVTGVEAGNIVCPCHGSAFKLADGSVAAGPAKRALPTVAVNISDGAIRLG